MEGSLLGAPAARAPRVSAAAMPQGGRAMEGHLGWMQRGAAGTGLDLDRIAEMLRERVIDAMRDRIGEAIRESLGAALASGATVAVGFAGVGAPEGELL